MEDELKHINNLNTIVLKKLFGSVFVHPLRGMDKTFAVSTRGKEQRQDLPNYDPNQVLLPHTDHTFYHTAAQYQGWYCLEGESENTFVSVPAVLRELNEKHPDMYRHLSSTPLAFGRQNSFYGPTVVNTTTDTDITTYPSSDEFKSFRWHPNLVGSLLCPYEDYKKARVAHLKVQELIRSEKFQLKVNLRPGNYYIWNNFRVLHGRERVFSKPRTGFGQTVPEQVVQDRYRELCVGELRGFVGEQWLVHLPMPQLRELVHMMRSKRGD